MLTYIHVVSVQKNKKQKNVHVEIFYFFGNIFFMLLMPRQNLVQDPEEGLLTDVFDDKVVCATKEGLIPGLCKIRRWRHRGVGAGGLRCARKAQPAPPQLHHARIHGTTMRREMGRFWSEKWK